MRRVDAAGLAKGSSTDEILKKRRAQGEANTQQFSPAGSAQAGVWRCLYHEDAMDINETGAAKLEGVVVSI
eukprot:COSAG05_NODE_621_length_8305_cov_3.479283_3_plen_71_part_00